MNEVECTACKVQACTDDLRKAPAFCPRRIAPEAISEAERIRKNAPEVRRIADVAKEIETEEYRVWPRVHELIELAKRMEFKKLGIAFCVGLQEETTQLAKILKSNGYSVSTVQCTVNGGCNPAGQALTLNVQKTDLNVIMSLCMGHDALFTNFSDSAVTILVMKDHAMYHNPATPLLNRS